MYGLDQELTKHYDAERVSKNLRTPKFPTMAKGIFNCLLKSVKFAESDTHGKLYEFAFEVTKSSSDLVVEGGRYTVAFFPKASKIEKEIFWDRISKLLMAVKGVVPPDATFDSIGALGELCKLTEELAESGSEEELDLPFRMECEVGPAKPNKKTGKIEPKHYDDNGNLKQYRNDTYSVLAA